MRLVFQFRLGWFVTGLGMATATVPAFSTAQDPPAKPAEAPAAPAAKVETPAPAPAPVPPPVRVPAPATVPAPRPGLWVNQHEAFLERAKKGAVDLLFLGDSITAGWASAKDVWSRHYLPRKAANFGIGGDRTQHILWRLDNGEVDAIHPKVVVLMIGTNNLGDNTDAEIADGVRAILDRLHSKLPDAKVLLLGIFPRGSIRDRTVPSVVPEPRIAAINTRLAAFDDGKTVKYLDIGAAFLEDGRVPRTNMPDFLHLTPTAYQFWADAMEPTLWKLLDEPTDIPPRS